MCRPGGRIGLANWTPDGYIDQMFWAGLATHYIASEDIAEAKAHIIETPGDIEPALRAGPHPYPVVPPAQHDRERLLPVDEPDSVLGAALAAGGRGRDVLVRPARLVAGPAAGTAATTARRSTASS